MPPSPLPPLSLPGSSNDRVIRFAMSLINLDEESREKWKISILFWRTWTETLNESLSNYPHRVNYREMDSELMIKIGSLIVH